MQSSHSLQAHKVILSACSPFFRSVLRRNQGAAAQQLVLYLKGVTYRDMEAVLTFMYHGEVNVAQDDLNSFLAVAEELRVKGDNLTPCLSNSRVKLQDLEANKLLRFFKANMLLRWMVIHMSSPGELLITNMTSSCDF